MTYTQKKRFILPRSWLGASVSSVVLHTNASVPTHVDHLSNSKHGAAVFPDFETTEDLADGDGPG